MGNWKPDRRTSIRKSVFLWIVPGQISGRWRASIGSAPTPRGMEIEFSQRFQEVSASARLDAVAVPVWETRIESDRLSFVIVQDLGTDDEASLYFDGKVSGALIEGSVSRGVGSARAVHTWRAERLGK